MFLPKFLHLFFHSCPNTKHRTSNRVEAGIAQRPPGWFTYTAVSLQESRTGRLVFLFPLCSSVERGKLRRLEHSPAGWQSFRCGGHRFIYSGGGRDAFQKLLVAPVAHARADRPRLVPSFHRSASVRWSLVDRRHSEMKTALPISNALANRSTWIRPGKEKRRRRRRRRRKEEGREIAFFPSSPVHTRDYVATCSWNGTKQRCVAIVRRVTGGRSRFPTCEHWMARSGK